jgi:hypothetical protein
MPLRVLAISPDSPSVREPAAPVEIPRPGSLSVVDIPMFFYGPFDHVANEVAPYVGHFGIVRRLACRPAEGSTETPSPHDLLHALPWYDAPFGSVLPDVQNVDAEGACRFSTVFGWITALDVALEWLGVAPHCPLAVTLDCEGSTAPTNHDVILFTGIGKREGESVRHVVLFHAKEQEILWIATTTRDATRPTGVVRASHARGNGSAEDEPFDSARHEIVATCLRETLPEGCEMTLPPAALGLVRGDHDALAG